ncbi:metallophosphoesterase family protein [Nocardia otitidiscaviarum]|uniref:metallophosphoesterase family protein n=1 Tax=Nocardia otitidiscaviarum TaxID=1823 RepID=UPI002456A73D|nr:metallophosphoesterase [Nocardia otitidiscaviarum]
MTDWDGLNPERLAFAGDWHANQHHARRAIRYAAEQGAQAILHVGDFAFDMRPNFFKAIQTEMKKTGLMLGWVDGNHDHHDRLRDLVAEHGCTTIPLRPNIFYLPRTYRWTWNGVRFLALGGAHSVDRPWRTPGREWWCGETISIAQAQKATDDGPADVMICHDVPAGVRIPCIEGNPFGFPQQEIATAERHRQLLRRVIDQVMPRRLFAGHYHCRLTADLNGGHYRTVVDILADDSAPVSDNTTILDLADL